MYLKHLMSLKMNVRIKCTRQTPPNHSLSTRRHFVKQYNSNISSCVTYDDRVISRIRNMTYLHKPYFDWFRFNHVQCQQSTYSNNDFLKALLLVDIQPDCGSVNTSSRIVDLFSKWKCFYLYLPESIAPKRTLTCASCVYTSRLLCMWLPTWYYYIILMITKWGEPEIPFTVNYGKGNVMKIRILCQRT